MPKITEVFADACAHLQEIRDELLAAETAVDHAMIAAANTAGPDSLTQIAEMAGISRPTMYKRLRHAEEYWQREHAADAGDMTIADYYEWLADRRIKRHLTTDAS